MAKIWTDETGLVIPSNRVTPIEKLREKHINKILKLSLDINKRLTSLKKYVEDASFEVYQAVMDEKNIDVKKRKGNFTWYNFDRSIKIEININEGIQFDETLIEACRLKLMEFLDANISTEVEFVKDLVISAFQTSHGKLDARKIMGLLKYKSKIKHQLYHDAMTILEESYRRVKSKMYSRIWVKDKNGSYEAIDLNYSSIKV